MAKKRVGGPLIFKQKFLVATYFSFLWPLFEEGIIIIIIAILAGIYFGRLA